MWDQEQVVLYGVFMKLEQFGKKRSKDYNLLITLFVPAPICASTLFHPLSLEE